MLLPCQRPYSIRTRIKTIEAMVVNLKAKVRDHIPLEQGLRPEELGSMRLSLGVRDHIPLEQGLRQ